MKTSTKLALLATLYLSQGLPFGFFTQALPALLRQEGVSLGAIGLTSLLAAPWALKFLWAPFVDRYGSSRLGRRKSWILPLQAGAVLAMATLAALDPADSMVPLLVGAVLLTNLLAATQDIATDGLAVTLLTPTERGPGNGVQVAGYRVGMIVGGGALLVAFERWGWSATFGVMAGLLALATVPIALHREAPAARPERPTLREGLALVQRPGFGSWLVLLAVYKGPDAMASGMSKPLLIDLGLDLADLGVMLGTVGFSAGLVGALLGGWGVAWLGRTRALLLFGALQTLGVACYLLPALGFTSMPVLYAVTSADTFLGGLATAALFTVMMDACREGHEGSDYTAQASAVVLFTGLTGALAGFSAEALGYAGHFGLVALVTGAGVAWVAWRLRDVREPAGLIGR